MEQCLEYIKAGNLTQPEIHEILHENIEHIEYKPIVKSILENYQINYKKYEDEFKAKIDQNTQAKKVQPDKNVDTTQEQPLENKQENLLAQNKTNVNIKQNQKSSLKNERQDVLLKNKSTLNTNEMTNFLNKQSEIIDNFIENLSDNEENIPVKKELKEIKNFINSKNETIRTDNAQENFEELIDFIAKKSKLEPFKVIPKLKFGLIKIMEDMIYLYKKLFGKYEPRSKKIVRNIVENISNKNNMFFSSKKSQANNRKDKQNDTPELNNNRNKPVE